MRMAQDLRSAARDEGLSQLHGNVLISVKRRKENTKKKFLRMSCGILINLRLKNTIEKLCGLHNFKNTYTGVEMHIQVNTDANIDGHEKLIHQVEKELRRALSHFTDQIMRVEVHLTDENGPKSGRTDKRCLMEARPSGHPPVAASNEGKTLEEAYHGAAKKLHRLLESTLKRESHHKGGDSIRTDKNPAE